MIKSESVLQAPAGTPADYFVLKTAQLHEAQIVSNDRYEQFKAEFNGVTDRRVPLMIVNGTVELYEPRLQDQPD